MVTHTRHLMANLVVSIVFYLTYGGCSNFYQSNYTFFIRTSLQNDKSSDNFHNHHKMY